MLTKQQKQIILDLAQQGLGTTEIHQRTGASHGQVAGIIARGRRRGLPIHRLRATPGTWGGSSFVQVTIPAVLYKKLKVEGQRKRIRAPLLIRSILNAAIEDDIVDAILQEDLCSS